MKLSDDDKRKLDGQEGAAVQEVMEYLVKLGRAFEADDILLSSVLFRLGWIAGGLPFRHRQYDFTLNAWDLPFL